MNDKERETRDVRSETEKRKTVLVEVTKNFEGSWFKVGDVFEVYETKELFYTVKNKRVIFSGNCKIVTEDDFAEGGVGGYE